MLLSVSTERRLAGAALGLMLAFGASASAQAAAPAGCAALQAKYPDWKGKTLVNAINPHTPGYEAVDPADPDKYIGFDIEMGEDIGECLGFKVTYKAVTFAALLTTLASGQADFVMSDIYATKERAKAGDFITYSKVFDGVLVEKGNPKGITGINATMCGTTAAEGGGRACSATATMSRCRWSTISPSPARRRARPSRRCSFMTTTPIASRRSSPAAPTPT